MLVSETAGSYFFTWSWLAWALLFQSIVRSGSPR